MLTSAGRSRRISESTALGVGSMMSMRRLCVRISKCSHKRLIDIIDPTPKAVDSLMRLDLPADVNIEIKL